MTFLGSFREEEEGSTPVLQLRTQTYMADPLITELEVRRALDGLNPHKGAGPDGRHLITKHVTLIKAFFHGFPLLH